MGNMIGIVFLIFFGLLFVGVPIGVSIGGTALIALALNPGLPVDIGYIYQSMFTAVDSFVLLAVPMFTLSGAIMARGGMSKKLFDFFAYFVGNKCGGMPCAVIITCLFYGAISGSSPATVVAVGSMTVPILMDVGYDRKFAVATVAVAGGLGVIIPPSIPFVVYGNAAGVSIGSLFLGGVVPGCVVAICLMGYAYFYCKTKGENREKLNASYRKLHDRGLWNVFKESFWALLTPVFILGGIYGGFVTPTEAAVISVVYALIICIFVYRSLKISELFSIFKSASASIAPMLYIVATAAMFGKVLTFLKGQDVVANLLGNTFESKTLTLLFLMLFLLVLGMVVDVVPAILVLAPVFSRLATMLDMNQIHMGVIIVVCLAVGFVTPPVGVNLYVATTLPGDVKFLDIAKNAVPYIVMFLVATLFIAFIPQLSLMLV